MCKSSQNKLFFSVITTLLSTYYLMMDVFQFIPFNILMNELVAYFIDLQLNVKKVFDKVVVIANIDYFEYQWCMSHNASNNLLSSSQNKKVFLRLLHTN